MQLHCNPTRPSAFGAFSSPTRCANCDEWLVAPLLTEFVEGGEIRHHWVCDGCGETSCTVVSLAAD
jgi:hypothetical protein